MQTFKIKRAARDDAYALASVSLVITVHKIRLESTMLKRLCNIRNQRMNTRKL